MQEIYDLIQGNPKFYAWAFGIVNLLWVAFAYFNKQRHERNLKQLEQDLRFRADRRLKIFDLKASEYAKYVTDLDRFGKKNQIEMPERMQPIFEEYLQNYLAATEVGDKEKIEYIRAELAKYSEKIQKDHTLSKITEKNFLSMVIGAFAGAAAGFALKKDPESALIGGLTGPAVTFLMNIINGLSSEARATAQVTSRVFLSLFP